MKVKENMDQEFAKEIKRIHIDRIPLSVAADVTGYVEKIEKESQIRAKELTANHLLSFGKLGYQIENINSLGYTNQYVVRKVQTFLPNNDHNRSNPGY